MIKASLKNQNRTIRILIPDGHNPMLAGVFLALFGAGILLHSVAMILIWVPGYILVHVLELKLVEEPELEKRFGPAYVEYRNRVPMFFPRLRQKDGSGNAG